MLAARVAVALLAWVVVFTSPAAALVVRGDHQWVSSPECPDGWAAPDFDASAWKPVAYPWLLLWPSPWEPDLAARPFWDQSGAGTACARRILDLAELPDGEALARVFVDDDYELWINGDKVGESKDEGAERPGETFDVTSKLRAGRNVLGLKMIDSAYEKGAYLSIDLPGVPEESMSAAALLRMLAPWAAFAAIAACLTGAGLLLRSLLRRVQPRVARLPPLVVAIATLGLAAWLQYLLETHQLYVAPPEQPWAEWSWQAVALVAAVFLALFSLRDGDGATDDTGPMRGEAVWLAAILALAAFLRIYRIDDIPVGLYQDEATNGADAVHLMEFESIDLWSDSVGGRPTLFLYLLGVALKVFGVSYLSLKVVPIALSLGAVVAVWAVARLGFGARAALWAAFFLAVSRWHIHYGRMAWEVNCVPFFSAAGFALLLRGVQGERERSIVAGAAVLALGLYTYAAYRAVVVGALLFLVFLALSADSRTVLRRHWPTLVRAGIVAGLVALPLVAFAFLHPERYWERYRDVSLTHYMSYYGTPLPWLHQIGKGLLSLNHLGDDLIRHSLPRAPQLDPITGVFFLLGLATAARPGQTVAIRLLWAWFLAFLGLASLTRDAPHATRYLGLVAPAALFAGLGAARLFARLRRGLRPAPLAWALALAAVVATAGVNAYQYFVLEANHPNADFEMNVTARTVCERAKRHRDIDILWTGDVAYWAGGPCFFLAWHEGRDYKEITPEDIAAGRLAEKTERPALFFIGPEMLEPQRNLTKLDADGLPALGLPGPPEIKRDRQGRLMFYIWDRTGVD